MYSVQSAPIEQRRIKMYLWIMVVLLGIVVFHLWACMMVAVEGLAISEWYDYFGEWRWRLLELGGWGIGVTLLAHYRKHPPIYQQHHWLMAGIILYCLINTPIGAMIIELIENIIMPFDHL